MSEALASASGHTAEERLVAEIVRRIQGMMFVDADGQTAVDFLGEQVRQTIEPDFATRLAAGAWRYARSAQELAHRKNEKRVTDKYDWLVEYMKPRLPSWGVVL